MSALVLRFPEVPPSPVRDRYVEPAMVVAFPSDGGVSRAAKAVLERVAAMKGARVMKAKKPLRMRKELHSIGARVRFTGNSDMRPGFRKHQNHLCEVVDVEVKVWDPRPKDPRSRRRVFRKYVLFDLEMKDERFKVFRCEDGVGARLEPAKGRRP